MTTFSSDSLLMSGSREERVLIALSMVDDKVPPDLYEEMFATHLNWPWIIMQAMQHRVICIMWENLKSQNRLKAAARCGLTKNWIFYAEQLSRASLQKNLLWLDHLEHIFGVVAQAGIPAVCIKGSALIGDIYHVGNRMLGDMDTLVPQDARSEISNVLHKLGFKHGIIDHTTSTLVPLSREKQRFWSLNAHLMPKFTLETGNPDVPFVRFAVGFDFFDPHDQYSVPSDTVIARRVRKSSNLNTYIPDKADMVVSLCAHIYREAISATFGFVGDNWHLWKFCDLRTYLLKHDCSEFQETVANRIAELGLEKPYYFALHYTQKVYGDSALESWTDLCDPGPEKDFLYELVDGHRRISYLRPFAERLFDMKQTVVPGMEPGWSKFMSDGEWW